MEKNPLKYGETCYILDRLCAKLSNWNKFDDLFLLGFLSGRRVEELSLIWMKNTDFFLNFGQALFVSSFLQIVFCF